jgi:hypothetical protein
MLALDAVMLEDVTWRRAAALAREWRDAPSLLAAAIESLWLEFDVDAHEPRPSVFVDFTERAYRGSPVVDRVAMIGRAVQDLRDGAPTDAMREAIRRCITNLPTRAVVPYVGVMGARPTDMDTARVCVHGLGVADVLPYLRAVGWSGDEHDVDDVLATLGDSVPLGAAARAPAIVHMDVGAAPLARVGLEYTFDRRFQLRGVLAESRLLARLESLGLVTEAKARALALWGGYTTGVLAHELWESVVARWVNHVKVICGDGARVAKAYLSAHHRPRAELRDLRRGASHTGHGAAE